MELFVKIVRIILIAVLAVGVVVKSVTGFMAGRLGSAVLDGVIFGFFMSLIAGTVLVFVWLFVDLADKSRIAKRTGTKIPPPKTANGGERPQ
jgi:uncharacterized membrane protein